MKKPDFNRYVPPGVNGNREAKIFFTGLAVAALFSLFFFAHYTLAARELYVSTESAVLKPGAVMAPFSALMQRVLLGFPVVALATAALVGVHYASHWQGGSRSIYLMRRLPDRWELPRRCLTLPLAGVVLCLLTAAALCLLYFWFYCIVTPAGCLPPEQHPFSWLLSHMER